MAVGNMADTNHDDVQLVSSKSHALHKLIAQYGFDTGISVFSGMESEKEKRKIVQTANKYGDLILRITRIHPMS